MNCFKGTCCNERGNPRPVLNDLVTQGQIGLAGSVSLDGHEVRIKCHARDGEMVETLVQPGGGGWHRFDFRRAVACEVEAYRDSPLRRAFCCSIHVREQVVVAKGHLEPDNPEFEPPPVLPALRLFNPTLCTVKQSRSTDERRAP